ncbi:fungal-specific transcription factor [Xylogone sp. PMI_703]|nr:fungal-specific transcription factor [Xylogone sp. PMI_703]
MFHTFQGLAPPRQSSEQSSDLPKQSANGVSKRITTPHACAECKRRKIRCDGRQPCGQCMGCRTPKHCVYDKHRQRVIPSRRALDALSQSLEECRTILRRLYPNRDEKLLLPLSRQELISLLDAPALPTLASQTSPSGSLTSPISQEFQSPINSTSEENQGLANLEPIPNQDTDWDEERRDREPIPSEADDVNALSLSVDRQSSYLGATSIRAAFLVMLKVAPMLRSFFTPQSAAKQISGSGNSLASRSSLPMKNLVAIPWTSEGQTLIDAYFNRVQILVPMLDEPSFRADYLTAKRTDAPWLALLNMVFVMGSIVANKSDNHSHINFYNQAKEHLGLDSFGSGHLETLQALALMGGYYLHYINRPNMANSIMGAALRMACAMGLHRESIPDPNGSNAAAVEQRRRTWWSLFCLDTWASTTLGRPSMGRWGPAITIRSPEEVHDPNVIGKYSGIVPLIENIKFCKISTQIQDVLAQSPLLRPEDRAILDGQLVQWHDNLPWILRSGEPCPESIYTARCIMKWRYQSLRIVLYRPVLLNLANRGSQEPPSTEEIEAVNKCREIARQTITDISREWTPNQMLGWNGVWFMYQASMIPLVSIFWESWNAAQVREWRSQIEIVLDAFDGMADWSLAARRSREVVAKMYEASKRSHNRDEDTKFEPGNINNREGTSDQVTGGTQPETEAGVAILDNRSVWDLDGMLWGNLPEGLDMPFDGMPNMGFDYPDGGSYDQSYMLN